MQTKPDISDLLPELQRLTLASKKNKKSNLYWDYRSQLHMVAQRYGISLQGYRGEDNTNKLIDLLDRDYPDWRGYRPAYLQQRQSAA